MSTRGSSSQDLITDVKSGLHNVEELLREAASSTGDKAAELRDSALSSLKRARETLMDVQDTVVERGRKVARATDDYVHDNPWRSLGVAVAAGFVIGLLINRR
ncbi:DUF883 domain-containing protein [Achromobacter sp. GG226]|uniref:DUF883 family protein n=1 Tax=Verticiella alkaliphila TaxID=2779529 RepID=UPI001C0C0056|nr:DUF883 family protein [Verticiella sp. GG226]MBU4611249.1 DUF883 domain-containing protein [Verticiella sp. GG226]